MSRKQLDLSLNQLEHLVRVESLERVRFGTKSRGDRKLQLRRCRRRRANSSRDPGRLHAGPDFVHVKGPAIRVRTPLRLQAWERPKQHLLHIVWAHHQNHRGPPEWRRFVELNPTGLSRVEMVRSRPPGSGLSNVRKPETREFYRAYEPDLSRPPEPPSRSSRSAPRRIAPRASASGCPPRGRAAVTEHPPGCVGPAPVDARPRVDTSTVSVQGAVTCAHG